ncbi:MAG: ATP-dependent DNA helicase RecG [Flavobacteriales bacterium CG_4_9_14_3_um_filter_40_17]|nr:MAG: ATP-dependent DNA helicase RecG [Flavobacteriales bacterium CG_4_9_14_3_um_filter_40_17]
MIPDTLLHPIEYTKGVGTARAEVLRSELGIHCGLDLLQFFPNRYVDKSRFYKINELIASGMEVQIIGRIVHLKTIGQKRGSRLVATFVDETGQMELVWFRSQKWFSEHLKINEPYVVFGRVNLFNGIFSLPHPEMELLKDFEVSFKPGMQAVYRSSEKLTNRGITNRFISGLIAQFFKNTAAHFEESLSGNILRTYRMISKTEALFAIHFPENPEQLAKAQFRLKFEELFFIQLQLIAKNLYRKNKIKGFRFEKIGTYFNLFYHNHLPFELTNAQKKVLKEIRNDLGQNAQMNRLLQGDVGSGKTIVALMAMLIAIDNDFQACLMAPTEILANQHFQSVSNQLKDMGLNVRSLTGSTKKTERKLLLEKLESGEIHILIGTHALLEDPVQFNNLGLCVIDEQHRFGVAQRSKMWYKNEYPPHILVMTATPIPRTLAMSLYGDLDLSVIDELPPGRKPIKTIHLYESKRLKLIRFMKDEIQKGRQIYIVYPLIQESEVMDLKNLDEGYLALLRDFPTPNYQVSVVHGKMKAEDKNREMERFVSGAANIMVATTVIEVGVDVPNASVMVIESAERFGLSQLHQLRGRVGRGAEQSFCILMSGNKLSNEAKTRLETMVATSDGFEIAEVDLKLRGPGDLMGKQQSGILNLKLADLSKDQNILMMARQEAIEIFRNDPALSSKDNMPINKAYAHLNSEKGIWGYIS